jgi:hypothetical protein
MCLVFEGNVQQLTFYLAAEWRHAVTFTVCQRGIKTMVLLFGFTVVFASIGSGFVMRSAYGRLNRLLTDNNRNNIRGITIILLQSGVRNFVLGLVHSFSRALPYEKMLSLLLCFEVIFATIFIAAIPLRAYRTLYPVWMGLYLTFARIFLIGTLFFDYFNIGASLL